MYDLHDTLGSWINAFDGHDDNCHFIAWAQDHLDEPVTIIENAPPELAMIAALRALGDMRDQFAHDTANWFADVLVRHTESRAIARWARERAHG